MNIRKKLIVYFLASIFIPTLLVTMVVYAGSRRIIDNKMTQLAEKNLDSVRLIVQQRLEFIDELTTLISLNPLIQEVLSADPTEDMGQNITEIITLDRALDSYYLSNYYATYDGMGSTTVPTIYLLHKPEYARHDISTKVQDIAAIENEGWYQAMGSRGMVMVVQPGHLPVVVARKLYDLKNVDMAEYAALLTIELDREYLANLLVPYKTSADNQLYLLDEQGHILVASDPYTAEAQSFVEALETGGTLSVKTSHNGQPVLVSTIPIETADLSLVSITSLSEINSDQGQLTRIVAILVSASMALALFMAILLSRNISRPIVQLVDSMKTVGEDTGLEIDISYHKNDEFGYLIGQYKRMISRIRELIHKLYTSEMDKKNAELQAKDAELKMLQSQINPHFLYNTLDSINLYAIRYDVPVISDMINSLANFFRYSLSRGRDVITIQEEVEHTRSYLAIQAMRLGERLQYDFQIAEDVWKSRIVKLVLQPLVENAIVHGFPQAAQPFRLEIKGYLEGEKIILQVCDNGAGGDAAHLNSLLAGEGASAGSFAIPNVHLRLRRTFGEGYGLCYRQNPGGGLIAEIQVPAHPEHLEENHD